jgi:AsmA protein
MDNHQKIKLLKIGGTGIILFFIFLLLFPVFFKGKVNSLTQTWLNDQIETELKFAEMNLTFFRHFPALTVSLNEVLLKGREGFDTDTLLYTKDLSFGIDVISLFGDNIKVNGIFLDKASINIFRDTYGNANFDIFPVSDEEELPVKEDKESNLEIEINKIQLNNSRFLYKDISLDFISLAEDFDYSGKGKLLEDIFELSSNMDIRSFSLRYEDIPYFAKKTINAKLITKINTESTALTFERNYLKINNLPVDFVGKLEFLPDGYDMNFILESVDSDFKDMLSLIPEHLGPWLNETKVRGKGDLRASLQGLYLPNEDLMPNLLMNLRVNDGYLSHAGSSVPLKDFLINFDLTIPGLAIEKTQLNLDSIYFNLGEGYFKGHFNLDGLESSKINSNLKMDIDLDLLDRAIGLLDYDLKGRLTGQLLMDGVFEEQQVSGNYKKPKYITTSIPKFHLKSNLTNGFFKWTELPEPIRDISWDLNVQAKDSIYQNMGIMLENLQFQVLDNTAKGHFKIAQLKGIDLDAALLTQFNLGEIKKFYPLEEGFILDGLLNIDIKAKGNYEPDKKLLPILNSQVSLKNGFIKTAYSELPVEDLSLILDIQSNIGSFMNVSLDLKPITFRFADHPFTLTANLENLEDLNYEVQSKGRIDLGKLYRTFGIEGYDVSGYILTDINLQGKQSDALKGRLNKLNNNGFLEMENIQFYSDFLPYPLDIHSGKFKIEQDKLFLEDFHAQYLQNQLTADGFLTNIISYLSEDADSMKGKLIVKSPKMNLNDFMFFAEDDSPISDTLGTVSGVVMIPKRIGFNFIAEVDTIVFDDYQLENFKGEISVRENILFMENTAFKLIGSEFQMKGRYHPINPYHAEFDYEIKAREFDIQRAYKEIPLFKEMVTAAEYAEGIASLDYGLSGRLDANMNPVYPSIVGGGTLGLKKIKLKGFRLMNSIARTTENEELSDPDLSDVLIKSSISNNLITIERTRMRIAGFRPRFEGQVSLDGDMSIAFRLGLPPLGIFGIPIKITGNADDYKIQMGKISKEDELEELEDLGVSGENSENPDFGTKF